MALQTRQTDEELVVIAGAIVVGMGFAAGVGAAVSWFLTRRAAPSPAHAIDPFGDAPYDDEELSPDELRQLAASEADIARGDVVPASQVTPRRRAAV
jgi:hypothetical protein